MFSERIRLLRVSYSFSQLELAKKLGVSKQSVSNWENGNILPSIDMLIKIAQVFHVSTDYILGLENFPRVDVTGLTLEQVTHIQQIVNDIRNQ